jgi:hypothetical protein
MPSYTPRKRCQGSAALLIDALTGIIAGAMILAVVSTARRVLPDRSA